MKGRAGGKDVQHSDDLLACTPAHLAHKFDARDQIYSAARPEEQAVTLYYEARHTYSLGVCYPNGRCHASSASDRQQKNRDALPKSIVDHGKREFDILRNAIDSDAFNDSIDLMPPPGTLALLVVVHDPMLNLRIFIKAVSVTKRLTNLVIKSTAFRIRKHYENVIRH